MKKVFISQMMKDKTKDEILEERERIIAFMKNKEDDIEILDTFFEDFNGNALQFLGKSISKLGEADLAVFGPGWKSARGCKIEHECCIQYNIPKTYYQP